MRDIYEIKEELKSYKYDLSVIKDMEQEIDDYKNKATSCTSHISGMPGGSRTIHDKIAEYAAIIADIEKDKYDRLIELELNKKRIEDNINRLKQPYKNILYFTYISKCENLHEVANIVHFEYSWTCKLHKKALKEYLKINGLEDKK